MAKIPIEFIIPGEPLREKIGTLYIYISGELTEPGSIEYLQSCMLHLLNSVSDNIEFNYTRFAYYRAEMKWIIPLNIFWKNDAIYKGLKKYLDKYFIDWEFDINLLYFSKGG